MGHVPVTSCGPCSRDLTWAMFPLRHVGRVPVTSCGPYVPVTSRGAGVSQVVVGNYGLSHDEERVQFGMWAMFPSVLFLSVDLRTVGAESKALLQNRRVIAINQDPLGLPGRRVANVREACA